jgi:PAS domain S-box-containing protein
VLARKPALHLGGGSDMTNDKHSALIENLKVYQECIACSPNGVIIIDDAERIFEYNKSAEMLTGIKREIALEQMLVDILPQIALGVFSEEERRCSINDQDLLIKKVSVLGEGPLSRYQILVMQDLSATVKLAMEVEKSQDTIKDLEMILEGSFDGILVTDQNCNVLMVNQAYGRLTAIGKEEMTGKNMRELLNPVYMKNSVALVVAEEKRTVSMHHTTRHGKSVIVTGTPVFDSNGELYRIVINLRDISEIYKLREELLKAKAVEKVYFQKMMTDETADEPSAVVIAANEKMCEIFSLAKKICNYNVTVLILGESGVGKEEMAKYIHNNSIRKEAPFVAINCGAIPETLLESELFGYDKGAFTGASKDGKKGLFELANGGTLFLDEIGDMPLNMQVKLLRFLENHEIVRVGATASTVVDVRILVATNKNLWKMVENGSFREDLYYRLNVVQLNIPPLRNRKEDIPLLCLYFLQKYNRQYQQNKKMTYDVIKNMETQLWRGNVRELRNTIEKMVVLSNNEYLQLDDLPWNIRGTGRISSAEYAGSTNEGRSFNEAIEDLERQLLSEALLKYKSTRKIAEALKIDQSSVVRKIEKYCLKNKD